jgi:hypothetical protein
MAIWVDVACNNPDNGIFVGKFHMMSVRAGADDLDFEGPWSQYDGVTFLAMEKFARIGRIRVPIHAYKQWYGNWCWDSIAVSWPDMLKIVNYLGNNRKRGWHMTNGPDDLFTAFNERHEITPMEWKFNNEKRHTN